MQTILFILLLILIVLTIPLLLIYLFLSANNGIFHDGGLKAEYLSLLPPKQTLPFIVINPSVQLKTLDYIEYPVVLKPDDCSGGGADVELVNNQQEAVNYLRSCGNKYHRVIIQKYCPLPKEYSILYERHPFFKNGSVISITEKIPVEQTKQFKVHNVGIGTRKSDVVDLSKYITPQFNLLIDNMTQKIPNLYCGRYDVKAKDLNSLLNGDFYVMELNNLLGVDHRSFVHTISDFDQQNCLIQLRWFFKRVLFGLENHLVNGPITIIRNLKGQCNTMCQSEIDNILNAMGTFKII